jgi:hypothetical protein
LISFDRDLHPLAARFAIDGFVMEYAVLPAKTARASDVQRDSANAPFPCGAGKDALH